MPLDADSVVLDCAMLKATLDRFAACAHPADSLVESFSDVEAVFGEEKAEPVQDSDVLDVLVPRGQ